jgi:hypothetical protein
MFEFTPRRYVCATALCTQAAKKPGGNVSKTITATRVGIVDDPYHRMGFGALAATIARRKDEVEPRRKNDRCGAVRAQIGMSSRTAAPV